MWGFCVAVGPTPPFPLSYTLELSRKLSAFSLSLCTLSSTETTPHTNLWSQTISPQLSLSLRFPFRTFSPISPQLSLSLSLSVISVQDVLRQLTLDPVPVNGVVKDLVGELRPVLEVASAEIFGDPLPINRICTGIWLVICEWLIVSRGEMSEVRDDTAVRDGGFCGFEGAGEAEGVQRGVGEWWVWRRSVEAEERAQDRIARSDDLAPARLKLRSDDEDGDNSDDEAAGRTWRLRRKKGRIARNFH